MAPALPYARLSVSILGGGVHQIILKLFHYGCPKNSKDLLWLRNVLFTGVWCGKTFNQQHAEFRPYVWNGASDKFPVHLKCFNLQRVPPAAISASGISGLRQYTNKVFVDLVENRVFLLEREGTEIRKGFQSDEGRMNKGTHNKIAAEYEW